MLCALILQSKILHVQPVTMIEHMGMVGRVAVLILKLL